MPRALHISKPMKRTLLFLLCVSAFGQTSVTWTDYNQSTPLNYVAWQQQLGYGPLSHQSLLWGTKTSSGIYATDMFGYNAGSAGTTNTVTHVVGTGSTSGICPTDMPTIPGDRHPDQLTMLGKRMWIIGGANQTCVGTNPGPNGNPRVDMYYFTDNATVSSGAWTQVMPTHINSVSNIVVTYESAMVGDSTDNILFIWGTDGGGNSHTHWEYCVTLDNPIPGTLTAGQITKGCTLADDWTEITGWSCSGADCSGSQPLALGFPNLIYDSTNDKIVLYGGGNVTTTVFYNQLYTFSLATKTWTEATATPPTAETASGSNPGLTPLAWDTSTGKLLYHQGRGGCAPCDYTYAPGSPWGSGTWTLITSTSGPNDTGTSRWSVGTYDSVCNCMIAYSADVSNVAHFWVGKLSASPVTLTTLTVSEALFLGGPTTGVARTDQTFCQGVPIPDATGLTDVQTLNLSGATQAQFKQLAVWPSSHVKYVKACGVLASLSAGGSASISLQTNGGGNTGSNMATDSNPGSPNTGTITVATGTATFTIKKAKFNGFDIVDVGSTHVILTSTSATRGLVLVGPNPTATYPANVTCGTCTTVYSSANDSASTCVLEDNGAVLAVVKCNGTLYDGSSHPYMHFTTRQYFYYNKTAVKSTVILRNADYSTQASPSADCNLSGGICTGQTFNSAYKGMASFEWRLDANITGTLSYTIANDTGTPTTGTLNQSGGTDDAYIYQGQANYLIDTSDPSNPCPYMSTCANTFTTDSGYIIRKNSTTAVTGSSTQIPAGWADIATSGGVGVEVGVYQMAAYFPKSLEFTAGGATIHIGIFASENGNPTGGPGAGTFPEYQAWPNWHIDDLFFNFHATAPASLSDEFQKFQAFLVMQPTVSYTNTTAVFPFTLATSSAEDTYANSTVYATANPSVSQNKICVQGYSSGSPVVGPPCLPDYGATADLVTNAYPVSIYRDFIWESPDQEHQQEFRWSNLQTWIKRGQTGRYLTAQNFYRFQAEKTYPHFDGVLTNGTDATINGGIIAGGWRGLASPQLGTGYQWPAILSGCTDNMSPGTACPYLTNSTLSFTAFPDAPHAHDYGMVDAALWFADQTLADGYLARKDYYLNTASYVGNHYYNVGGGVWYIRATGIYEASAARLSTYLTSIADTDGTAVLANGVTQYTDQNVPDLCVADGAGNLYPSGCTLPPNTAYPMSGYDIPGVSKVRGASWTSQSRGQGYCIYNNSSTFLRWYDPFAYSLYVQGLLELRAAKGSAWSEYENSLDLAYGVSSWMLSEVYQDNGSSLWYDTPNLGTPGAGASALYNGFPSNMPIDFPGQCNAPHGPGGTVGTDYGHGPLINFSGATYDPYSLATGPQGMYMLFQPVFLENGALTTSQQRKLKLAWQNVVADNSRVASVVDLGQYQMSTVVNAIVNPKSTLLQDVSFSCSNCSGSTTSYTLTWTEPTGTTAYRVKWCCASPYGAHSIPNSGGYSTIAASASEGLLGYDEKYAQTFSLAPATYMPWFAATAIGAANEPTPGTSSQSITIATSTMGLTAADFSVKAFFPQGAGSSGGSVLGGSLKLGGSATIH